MTRVIPTGRRVPNLVPGDEQWLRLITGSKVAAIVGLSPWQSRFSLWHLMAGNVEPPEPSAPQERGHYLEPVICKWWADNHPGYRVRRTGSFIHRHRSWQAATPDRLGTGPDGVVLLEAKTDAGGHGWGLAGTDEIPIYYRTQIMWTLDVLGLQRAHVPMLTSYLEFRNYVVEYDADDAEFLRTEALAFRRSLEAGEPPDIDMHSSTYKAIQLLHPDIEEGREVPIDAALAERYRTAVLNFNTASDEKSAVSALVAAALGNGQYAVDEHGVPIAQRVNGRRGAAPVMKTLLSRSEQEQAA